jgi:hypothetical protein
MPAKPGTKTYEWPENIIGGKSKAPTPVAARAEIRE